MKPTSDFENACFNFKRCAGRWAPALTSPMSHYRPMKLKPDQVYQTAPCRQFGMIGLAARTAEELPMSLRQTMMKRKLNS